MIAIRSLDDTKKVAAMLPDVEHVVVIGGGVLGLEAAWELKKAGCQVTVLEAACQLMGRQLDDAAGEMLKHISEQQGVQIYTGVSIALLTVRQCDRSDFGRWKNFPGRAGDCICRSPCKYGAG